MSRPVSSRNRLILFILLTLIDCRPIVDYLRGVNFPIWNQIKEWLISTIINPVCGALNWLEDALNKAKDWLFGLISGAYTELRNNFNWLWDQIQKAYNGAVNWAKTAINNLSNAWSYYWNIVKTYAGAIIDWFGRWLGRALLLVNNLFDRIYSFLTQLWNNFIALVTTWFNNIYHLVVVWWNNLVRFLTELWNRFVALVVDWWNKLVYFVGEAWNKFVWYVTQGFKFLVDLVNDPVKVLGAFIIPIAQKFVDILGEAWSMVTTALMTMNVNRWMR